MVRALERQERRTRLTVICLVSGATPSLLTWARRAPGVYGRLINPRSGDSPIPGLPWACDNSAFSGFEPDRFITMLERLRDEPGCLWVSAPDVVANAQETLWQFEQWEPVLRLNYGRPVAFVAQDGLSAGDVPWDRLQAFFIGGTTEFKLGAEARELAGEAKARGKWIHVGRVGTKKRIRYCQALGADSIDGGVFSSHPRQAFRNFTDLLINPEPSLEAGIT